VAEGVAVAICCVPFGRGETVRKAFGSGNCGAAAADAATVGATSGVLTTETGGSEDAPTVDCAAPADVGVKFVAGGALANGAWSPSSIGGSFELTPLTGAGCVTSLRGVASASLEVATVW
jgi:hypothetical protein